MLAQAGILLALTVPCRARIEPRRFLSTGYAKLEALTGSELTTESMIHDREQFRTIVELHEAARAMRPVGLVLEEDFYPILIWIVLSLFAFFNAGVRFGERFFDALTHPVALGIILSLLVGRQVGVTLFAWLVVKNGKASLPEGVTWKMVYGTSWLAGIGFTMSLFISDLAFPDPVLVSVAKVGILVASLVAGLGGYLLLRILLPNTSPEPPAASH